jgi:2-oxoglutarate/2-oxoacid ferredoxin oxidoreductase subunit beta
MAEVTQLIHRYLRHNKKFPLVFCPGCGHGIVLGSLVRAVDGLGLAKDQVVLVAGIGCSGRIAAYVDFNTVHATHGRALALATGIKMANPELVVIAVMGDGDACSIGGNHLIHAARRNIGLTALVLNNGTYGMTGGQTSPTTPPGARSHTSPWGQLEKPFDLVELVRAAGANGVARGTVFHVKALDTLLREALGRPGFNFVEALTPCFTQFGRQNGFADVVAMYTWLRDHALPRKRYETMADKTGLIPIGTFAAGDEPGLETRYAALRQSLVQAKEEA